MDVNIRMPIYHMLQGLAHWMAYRNEVSDIRIIESDAVLVATDILRSYLSCDYIVEREISMRCLQQTGKQRIDLGVKLKSEQNYRYLFEFKLADAKNSGYGGDVQKLSNIKLNVPDVECYVVILYRKSCQFDKPKELVNGNGKAIRKKLFITKENIPIQVRRVCNSFVSSTINKSMKTICLEVLK